MRKLLKNLALAAVAVVGAVSCSESGTNDDVQPTFEGVTITAAVPSNEAVTKVEFAEGIKGIDLKWEANDQFKLYDDSGAFIDTFVTAKGDGSFNSSNENLQLIDGTTYTAKFNGEATTAEQDGNAISDLSGACQMEAKFTYKEAGSISIVFAHTKAIMTFKFTSEEHPAKLVFQNGELGTYTVNYSKTEPDGDDYTSYIMIEPCEAVERTLTFTLYDSEDTAYDIRKAVSKKAFVEGKRYTSPVSTLDNIVWSGTGTLDDPYLISNASHLRELSRKVNAGEPFSEKYFKMTNNIDLGGIDNDGNGVAENEFTAIGYFINATDLKIPFKGTFDGEGYTVKGLYINQPDADSKALFGCIENSTIINLSVAGSVIGKNYIAGVVGYSNYSTVANCYNTASVMGDSNIGGVVGQFVHSITTNCCNVAFVNGNSLVGGIVGYSSSSTVANCYNTASVEGCSDIGGIAGRLYSSTITNCYNVASVVGDYSYSVGGVVGRSVFYSIATNCYWDSSVAGMQNTYGIGEEEYSSSNVEEMNTAAMQAPAFLAELNSNACVYNYSIKDDESAVKACAWVAVDGGYPTFDYDAEPTYTVVPFEGEGTEANPYKISSAEDMRQLSLNVNLGGKSYENEYLELQGDIDLGGIDSNGYGIYGSEFTAIGCLGKPFCGIFNGAGYTVKGLYINKPETRYQGLFGLTSGATIKNLSVAGSVTGEGDTGGIVGEAAFYSIIANCYNRASVVGSSYDAGGVVGFSDSSTVTNCYNRASVVGSYTVGGVVGFSYSSTVTNCYNRTSVVGSDTVGGVVGCSNSSTVTNCYNTASVVGKYTVGGVMGCSLETSTVTNCYWDNSITGAPAVGIDSDYGTSSNVIGKSTAAMQSSNFAILLNNNAYNYNQTSPAVKACAWEAVQSNFPTFDYDAEPEFTQFDEIEEGVDFGRPKQN